MSLLPIISLEYKFYLILLKFELVFFSLLFVDYKYKYFYFVISDGQIPLLKPLLYFH